MTAIPNSQSPSTPIAGQGASESLFASAALGASGAWARSNIVAVKDARAITLLITYTTDATSGTDGFAEIVPMVAYTAVEPGAGDAAWYPIGVPAAAAPTEATLASGTLPAGTDFTGTPSFAKVKYEPLAITTDPADADTDVIQLTIRLDVTDARWFQLMAHEAGDTSNPGTLAISYVLSC